MLPREKAGKGRKGTIHSMLAWALVLCAFILTAGQVDKADAQDYQTRKLIRNLLKIGYPLTREDVIALDKIGMRFDSTNRIDVLEKILVDRASIHDRKRYDYFTRTEVICDALRLLDEHNLPVTHSLIDNLNREDGWELREKALLAFMAAKRGIRYRDNTDYLLAVLPQYDRDIEKNYGIEASQAIIDIMNFLTYLSELFGYKGDRQILLALFEYSANAYGFPAEYLSHIFVDMFLFSPEVFVSNLADQDERTRKTVTTALVFGMRNNQVREKVKKILSQNRIAADQSDKSTARSIVRKLRTQIDHVAEKTAPKMPRQPVGGDK